MKKKKLFPGDERFELLKKISRDGMDDVTGGAVPDRISDRFADQINADSYIIPHKPPVNQYHPPANILPPADMIDTYANNISPR